jgi:hypothetical protein
MARYAIASTADLGLPSRDADHARVQLAWEHGYLSATFAVPPEGYDEEARAAWYAGRLHARREAA